jgi:hypothetical protein
LTAKVIQGWLGPLSDAPGNRGRFLDAHRFVNGESDFAGVE